MPALAPATVQIALTLLQSAPQLIGLVQSSFDLFNSGTITEQQLTDLWTQAGKGVQAEIARWKATPAPA
jgi:hypothetical protein